MHISGACLVVIWANALISVYLLIIKFNLLIYKDKNISANLSPICLMGCNDRGLRGVPKIFPQSYPQNLWVTL